MFLSTGTITSALILASLALTSALPTPTSKPAVLPVKGTSTDLSAPDASLTLKSVGLGRGIQNYTCASRSAVPVAVGAVARLYEALPLAQQNQEYLNNITRDAVYANFSHNVAIIANHHLPAIGNHFFDVSDNPTFELCQQGLYFSGKKTESEAAPSNATKGPNGSTAVAWLQLKDNGLGLSKGLSEVYRVESAGGSPPASCQSMGAAFSVQYAAQYWFYG